MVYTVLMDVFDALADPTRRKIMELLANSGPLSATDICDQFQVSPPAISQHLKILREAELVLVEKQAQQRIYRINPGAMLELEDRTTGLKRLWSERFDALEMILESEKHKLIG
jgi:DNA-binding transcriptional ArsR family regulator